MKTINITAGLLEQARQIYQETGILAKGMGSINIKTGEAVKITAEQIKKYIFKK